MGLAKAITAAVVLVAGLVFVSRQRASADGADAHNEGARAAAAAREDSDRALLLPPFSGILLDQWTTRDDEVIAPAPSGRTAHLAIDPALQRATERIFRRYRPWGAAAVVLETATGRARVWASYLDSGSKYDLCTDASAPAASIFKIVTGAALVENAGLSPDFRQCYAGGESRISALDLIDDPRRDRWCVTLGEAMGKSVNTVFARLALKHLTAPELEGMAKNLGFGETIPFDVAVAPSTLHLPDEKIGFARTAAGFYNTTLSPFEGANMASAIANHGEVLRPVLVESISDSKGTVYRAPERVVVRRAIAAETAAALTSMMENTVTVGTCAHAFRAVDGHPFLPGIAVAGKTGTLSSVGGQQLYTWFVGFAPSRAPEVALAVLVVNQATIRAKANTIARDILRAYFAGKGAPGVSKP